MERNRSNAPKATFFSPQVLRQALESGWIYSQWILFLILAFLTALFMAWHLLARVNFLYPVWYEAIGIDKTIALYGPRNRYRDHFETTSKAEREQLFSAIVAAIHHRGKGLDTLAYSDPAGRSVKLLRPPEIIHLQDVSRLVEVLLGIGRGALFGWLLLVGLLRLQGLDLPPVRTLILISLGLLGGMGGIILFLGPVNVFYALHTWIFPPGHPWFFYYEDSLLTMLMKAPVIFGYIALTLVAVSLIILSALLFSAKKLYRLLPCFPLR
jgi:hypothetical protein